MEETDLQRPHVHRLFVALPLPEPVARAASELAVVLAAAGEDVRAVAASNLHVTLAFLGNRPASDVEAIGDAVEAAAREHQRIPLHALRLAAFGGGGAIALRMGSSEEVRLRALHGSVVARLVRLGVYTADRRAWQPHVTVARRRGRQRGWRPPPEVPIPRLEFECDRLVLVESLPDGAYRRYEHLRVARLGTARPRHRAATVECDDG